MDSLRKMRLLKRDPKEAAVFQYYSGGQRSEFARRCAYLSIEGLKENVA